MLWFCEEIFPKVLKEKHNLKLHIVGSNPTKEIIDLESDNIIVRGFMEDIDLSNLYSEVRVTIAPLRYGAGIKGKIIESMYNGVPVVTTSCGAEGICDKILMVADSAEKFAKEIILTYSNYDKLNNLSAEGKEFINENYSIDSAIKKIKEIF